MIQAERPMRTTREERGTRTPYGTRVFEGENMVSCAGFLTNQMFHDLAFSAAGLERAIHIEGAISS